jgi:hypothetical protein
VAGFEDANLYQLWHHATGPQQLAGVSRLVLRKDDEVVAMAEVRLFQVPLTKHGIAYIRWGPLWRVRSRRPDPEIFRQAVRALVNEFVSRRGMILRLNPRMFTGEEGECVRILEEEGLSREEPDTEKRTLVIDLAPSLEDLRKSLDKKWRNCLSKAERADLTIATGTSVELFQEFAGVYNRMLSRKQFAPTASIAKHLRIQKRLPDNLKMSVVLARQAGKACAGAVYSSIGNTGVYLFGATDEIGMQTSGSYLVQWNVLKHLKEIRIQHYDLNGINPDSNPGTYHFKKGLAGRNGADMTFAGQFQAFDASMANRSILLIERLRHRVSATAQSASLSG